MNEHTISVLYRNHANNPILYKEPHPSIHQSNYTKDKENYGRNNMGGIQWATTKAETIKGVINMSTVQHSWNNQLHSSAMNWRQT